MKNSEVAKQFSRGHAAAGSNFYTDGKSIWSYGDHFKMARHYAGYTLVTIQDYSNTTAKHKSHVVNALHGYDYFIVPNHDIALMFNENFEKEHVKNLQYILRMASNHIERYRRARKNNTKQFYLMRANHYLNQAFRYTKVVTQFDRKLSEKVNSINNVNLVNEYLIDNDTAIDTVYSRVWEMINNTASYKANTFITTH